MTRLSGRAANELREVILETGVSRYAEGSCLAKFGHTHVLCTASFEDSVPPWRRGSGKGWVTGEYAMLPRATLERTPRESTRGKPSGRTQEIQRLIGRALRASIDLEKLGERQIVLDCDVLQADGGTRTASVTGAWVALKLCCDFLREEGVIKADPVIDQVAAVSCGVVGGAALLDLDYGEDSSAEADANFVMTASGGIVEVQATAEDRAFPPERFDDLMGLARSGIATLIERQKAATG